jgi:hypothetical protein
MWRLDKVASVALLRGGRDRHRFYGPDRGNQSASPAATAAMHRDSPALGGF